MKYHVLIEPKNQLINDIIGHRNRLKYSSLKRAKLKALQIINKVKIHDVNALITTDEDWADEHEHHEYDVNLYDVLETIVDEDEQEYNFFITAKSKKSNFFEPNNIQKQIIESGYRDNVSKLAVQSQIEKEHVEEIISDFEHDGGLDMMSTYEFNFIRRCLKNSNFFIENDFDMWTRMAYGIAKKDLEDLFYVKIPTKK